MNSQNSSTNIENEVIQGLEFLLTQLINETKWPRTVATKLTDNAQIIVYSKEEALKMYKDSNYMRLGHNSILYFSSII